MKRKFELGRAPANTKVGDKRVRTVRVRGGNQKFRALKLDSGNFAWAGEAVTRKTRILNVVYNATSNELVRTNTLVKGAVVSIDSHPFQQWYSQFYNEEIGKGKGEEIVEEEQKGKSYLKKAKKRRRDQQTPLSSALLEQFKTGRLYARLTSRPGQCGRADGYILEGEELNFYQRKMTQKKKK